MITNKSPVLRKLISIMDVDDKNVCSFINNLLDESWRYIIPFTIRSKSKKKSLPIWSFIDQIGMVIRHSFNANFQMITFQYLNLKKIYSILFPIKGKI